MLLEVSGLSTEIVTRSGRTPALRAVSLGIAAGEAVGVVGESGSGKSMLALAMMGLLPPAIRITAGSIRLDGEELVGAPEKNLRRIRGARIGLVFQEPMTALNPLQSIGSQVAEALTTHGRAGRAAARRQAIALLDRVGIPDAPRRAEEYPHRLSGGLRQRAVIAMALACGPALLIADEPTTALDVTIQAQILELMRDLKTRVGAAIVLITHDLGVVAEVAERVVVMYAGKKVEEAAVGPLFRTPRHPYTQGLLGSMPKLGSSLTGTETRLAEIPGLVPSLKQKIQGCVFASRCPHATDLCREIAPALETKAPGHVAACHYAVREAIAA
jgi:peptide/nickel transport system ATP-binding protein